MRKFPNIKSDYNSQWKKYGSVLLYPIDFCDIDIDTTGGASPTVSEIIYRGST